MTFDYPKLNQVMTPILAAVQDVESLFDQINISAGIQYAVIDLANVFFSVPVHKDHQYTRGQKYTITAYLKGLLTFPMTQLILKAPWLSHI